MSRSWPLGLRLALLHVLASVGIGVYVPFFPIWLEGRGLDPPIIGIILAVPMLVRIGVTAPILSLFDRGLAARSLMIAANLVVAAGYASLVLLDGPAAIAFVAMLIAIAQAPIVPTSDLVTIDAIRRDPGLHYGRVRLWGSISFLSAGIVAGYALAAWSSESVLWLLIGLALVATLLAALVVPQRTEGRALAATPNVRPELPTALVLMLAAVATIQASHAALYAFGTIEWRSEGHASSTIGYLWATGVVAEIVLFAVIGRSVGRADAALKLILLGGMGAVLRFSVLALAPDLATTFLMMALHGLSFGATHLGAMAALAAYAPEAGRGRAQGILAAMCALAMAAATALSGALYAPLGKALFAVMVVIALAGLAFALGARWRLGRQ